MGARLGGAGGEASPQAMASVGGSVEPSDAGCPLHQAGDVTGRETACAKAAVDHRYGPKQGTIGEGGSVAPREHGAHWVGVGMTAAPDANRPSLAFLIGL